MDGQTYADAVHYVATTPTSGLAQYLLLARSGLRPSDTIVEIGCGTLHFAKAALTAGHHYAGMDPHPWLARVANDADPVLAALTATCMFSQRDDFDIARAFGMEYDWLIAHSILSHTSRHQVRQFFRQTRGSAAHLLVSANLVDRAAEATIHDEWVYPGAVTVTRAEVWGAAFDAGFGHVSEQPMLKAVYMSWCPAETHDWILCE